MNDECIRAMCSGCCRGISRRQFVRNCGAAVAVASGITPRLSRASEASRKRIRVATVFLSNTDLREIWPYPAYDTERRRGQVMGVLRETCPDVEFLPIVAERATDAERLATLNDEVDGYLVYVMTLDWSQGQVMADIGKRGKPMLVVDEFLGGSGTFLTRYSGLRRQNIPAAAVSSARLEDLATVVPAFRRLGNPAMTPQGFARHCERLYRQTFPTANTGGWVEDPIAVAEISDCVKQLRASRFLIVGRGRAGEERDFAGATGRYLDFGELRAHYDRVDRDDAAEWAERWSREATTLEPGTYVEPSQPTSGALRKAGGVYLATLRLLEAHGTDTITMNCLGGFSSGDLPAYPCLGFMQMLNDGGQGVCEAMPDDTVSMLMARILTGRPGFVSDPALDTSRNQIVYAHCVGTTKVFGPNGDANDYHIRTLHNRDPRGACSESLMPAGYLTTSFRTNVGRKLLVIHQAKSVGTLETERGCRTKLVGEVRGDIGKLFHQWDHFGWHRVTVFGDVREPLIEFGKALGFSIIEEA